MDLGEVSCIWKVLPRLDCTVRVHVALHRGLLCFFFSALYKLTVVQTQRDTGVTTYSPDEPPRQLLPFSSDCLPDPKTTVRVAKNTVSSTAPLILHYLPVISKGCSVYDEI